MQQPAGRTQAIARLISVVGHPFLILPITIVLATMRNADPLRALAVGAVAALLIVAPLLIVISRKVRRGEWNDYDVSDQSNRKNLYPIAISITLLSILALRQFGAPNGVVRGVAVSSILLIVAAVITRWTKISLHMIFGVFAGVALIGVNWGIAVFALLLAIAVGWSRVVLSRHTLLQTVLGAILGAVGGLLTLFPIFPI